MHLCPPLTHPTPVPAPHHPTQQVASRLRQGLHQLQAALAESAAAGQPQLQAAYTPDMQALHHHQQQQQQQWQQAGGPDGLGASSSSPTTLVQQRLAALAAAPQFGQPAAGVEAPPHVPGTATAEAEARAVHPGLLRLAVQQYTDGVAELCRAAAGQQQAALRRSWQEGLAAAHAGVVAGAGAAEAAAAAATAQHVQRFVAETLPQLARLLEEGG
jgi:type IV secretory pathway VirB10-like protein